ncbi:MAG: hypothetical protein ACLQJR_01125 [Stellaceae bacterium]
MPRALALWRRPAEIAVALADRRGAALLLGALCGGLAVLVATELAGAPDASTTAPSPAAATTPPLPPLPAAFRLPPLASYAEVAERPLFSATRQKPPAEPGQDLLGKSGSFVLLGVVISEAGRAALVQHGHPVEIARVSEGQAVEGWTVQSILPDRVVLEHGATEYELKLKDVPAAAPGTPRPPPRG